MRANRLERRELGWKGDDWCGCWRQCRAGWTPPWLRRGRWTPGARGPAEVLAVLNRRRLVLALFPRGGSTKEQVRAEAAARGLAVADKPDSHDVCFIPDGDTRAFLAARLGSAPGRIVAEDGTELGA